MAGPHDDLRDRPIGELLKQLSNETTTLVRQELELAKAEVAQKGQKAGKGAGMFGGAGVVALYGVGVLIAAAVMGLATAVEPWLAAVIVGVVLLAVAGVLALSGKKQVEQATPPKPEQAMASVQRDVQTVKESARR